MFWTLNNSLGLFALALVLAQDIAVWHKRFSLRMYDIVYMQQCNMRVQDRLTAGHCVCHQLCGGCIFKIFNVLFYDSLALFHKFIRI